MIFDVESKNANHSSIGALYFYLRASWRGAQGGISYFLPKKSKFAQNFSKFAEIWTGDSLWGDMLSQGSLNQDSKSIFLLSLFFSPCCFPQFSLQALYSALHISLSATRLPPCQCIFHIRGAVDHCLQQQSKCYLHLGWKGPRF